MIRAILAMAALAGVAQDPEKGRHPWATWKVGSVVKFAATIEAGGEKQEGSLSWTLEESGDKGFKVKQIVDLGGNVQELAEEWGPPAKDGEETLKVEGKEYKCAVWKITGTSQGRNVEVRYSVAEGKPTPLRWVRKADGNTEVDVTASKLAETLTLAGKKYESVKAEGAVNFGGGEIKTTAWMSSEVPGYLLKAAIGVAGDALRMSFEVSAVDLKK